MSKMDGQISKADIDVHLPNKRYKKSKPESLADIMKEAFNPSNMGPGMKRGMVLYIYRSKIREATGSSAFMRYLVGASMADKNNVPQILWLRFKNDVWRAEMRMHCHTIKELINERLG